MGRGPRGTGVEPLQESIRLRFTWKGRRHYETLNLKPSAANIKAAERLVATIKAEIAAGIYDPQRHFPDRNAPGPTASEITFSTYADQWLETLVAEFGTVDLYTKSLRKTWKPAFGDKAIRDIRHSDVARVVAERRKKVSGKTINNDLIPLRAIFSAAMSDFVVDHNPTERIRNLKHQSPLPDPFTRKETEMILQDLADNAPVPVWAYYTFAFLTGARPSEMIVLRWGKIDWNAKTARIDAARTNGREKVTKTHTVRDVDLSRRAVAALASMKPYTFAAGASGVIFINPHTGEPWHDDSKQREAYFHPCLKRLGIRLRDAYQCRHTYATSALMAGVNPAYIARQLGHTNTGMLFKRYARWIDGADNGKEAAKVAAIYNSSNDETGHELATRRSRARKFSLKSMDKSGSAGRIRT